MGLGLSTQALAGGAAMKMGSQKGSSQRALAPRLQWSQALVQQATYSHPIFAGAGLARSPETWWTTSTRAPSSSCSW